MGRGLFVPVDVNFDDDPKVIEAGPEGELVYLRSLRLAKRLGGNGFIHRAHLVRLASDLVSVRSGECDEKAVAGDLVRVGLWLEVDDGWVIAAWLKHNPSDEEIEESRTAEASRKAAWRKSRRDTTTATERDEVSHGTGRDATRSEVRETVKSESQGTEIAPRTARARDVTWDAIVECWHIDEGELTDTERGRLNKACKQLRDVQANPDEIPRRRARYRIKYPGVADTPIAIASRWSELRQDDDGGGPKVAKAHGAIARAAERLNSGS